MHKHFDKDKKNIKSFEDREQRERENQKKKKLKPAEKTKYRVKGYQGEEEDE